jgi:S-formylglutathione hydrolase
VTVETLSDVACFGGRQLRLQHASEALSCAMTFSVYLPPQARAHAVPVVYWLSGLTCTDENFVTKAGAQRAAAALGLALVAPDTSPRGDGVPDDLEGAYDFGLGAGFYLNATEAPFAAHYHMAHYVEEELPLVLEAFPELDHTREAISGHSMGGHGALTIALRNPSRFRSVSAFAPICAPSQVPWGQKAFRGYLGEDRSAWARYDACTLLAEAPSAPPLRVDQGAADAFLETHALDYRLHDGYDHSYFFIASFIDEHLAFHAQHLAGA